MQTKPDIKSFKKSAVLKGIAAFFIPVFLLLLIYALNGMMPFGNTSIMTGDCIIQYSAYMAYMREILSGSVSPFYTFAKVLGGDMAGFLSYYLLSPFNLILLFFENSRIQEAILVLILLKTGAAGFGMSWYLQKKAHAQDWLAVLFSTAYALMGYNIAYQHNVMWLDGLVLLPFIVWGIERVIQAGKIFDKRNTGYLVSLGLLLVTNYYIGYMLCIFSVLYGFYYLMFDRETAAFTGKMRMRAAKSFLVNSCLAGGCAAITLLPTVFSLRGGKAAFDLRELFDFTVLYPPLQVFKELFIGNFALKEGINTLPNIYCGIMILLFAAVYFMNPQILKRERIGSIILLAVCYLSFYLAAFDRIWHGTTVPAGAPHRYSFLFSFFLILAAYRGYRTIVDRSSDSKTYRKACLLYLVFFVFYMAGRKAIDAYTAINLLIGSLLCVAVYRMWKTAGQKVGILKSGSILLTFGIIVELVISGYSVVHATGFAGRKEFRDDTIKAEKYVDRVKEDNSWYRMEQSGTNVTMNDAMFFQYNGLWSYSSCEKERTKRLAGKFGLNDRSWWIIYHNEVPAASESILGLKYVITNQELAAQKNYLPVEEYAEDGVKIYENPYALPLGVLVEPEVKKVNMETWDVFAIENELWKRMTGEEEDIYTNIPREEVQCEEHIIEYEMVIEEEEPVYTCFRNYGTIEEMQVLLNGEEISRFIPEMQSYCLGTFREGDELTIRLLSENTDISWYDLYFYYEKIETLERYSRQLQQQGMQMVSFTQDKIKGTVHNESENVKTLLLTIPADAGWRVLVDGVVQKPEAAADYFMGIAISPGTHEIECRFIPEGLWLGAAITLMSFCVLLAGRQAACFRRGKNQPADQQEKMNEK